MSMGEITVSRTERHECTNICPWKYTKWQHGAITPVSP